jgi:hypothetical protein
MVFLGATGEGKRKLQVTFSMVVFSLDDALETRLQCVKEVVRLSKLQQSTCLPGASRIGGTVRDGLKHDTSKPPLLNI